MPYVFGGLELETDFTSDQLRWSDVAFPRPRLAVHRRSAAAPVEDVLHRSDGRYRLSCGTAGEDWVFRSCFDDSFAFRPAANRIDCHVVSTDDAAWHDVLFRRVLPRIATTYGATAIHAAAIAVDDRCLLLLGRSGAGKSTLTTFCATAGWNVLSDDTTLVWAGDRIVVEPVQRGMGVWDDTREALSLPTEVCAPMPGYHGRKWWFRPADAAPATARPLSAIVVLERSPDVATPSLTRLDEREMLSLLTAQDIPFLPGAQPGAATARAFGRLVALARRVAGFRLVYPDGYAALPRTEAALRAMPLGDAA